MSSQCSKCQALIEWVMTKTGGHMPIDAASFTAGEKLYDHKKHVSHFATCPAAAHFRKKKP